MGDPQRDLHTHVNEHGGYVKKDGSAMTAFQIHGRTKRFDPSPAHLVQA
jgi:hypothetical protein